MNDVLREYRCNQRNMIISKLREIRDFELKKRKQSLNNPRGRRMAKTRIVCERDRMRLKEFMTNRWISEILKKTDKGKLFGSDLITPNLKRQIDDEIQDFTTIQEIFKDIRYCYYKFFGETGTLKYSKNETINKIFEKVYPDMNPDKLKYAAQSELRAQQDKERALKVIFCFIIVEKKLGI